MSLRKLSLDTERRDTLRCCSNMVWLTILQHILCYEHTPRCTGCTTRCSDHLRKVKKRYLCLILVILTINTEGGGHIWSNMVWQQHLSNMSLHLWGHAWWFWGLIAFLMLFSFCQEMCSQTFCLMSYFDCVCAPTKIQLGFTSMFDCLWGV